MLFKDFYNMYAYDMHKLWLKWIPITKEKSIPIIYRDNKYCEMYDYQNRDVDFMKFMYFAYENSF